MSNQPVSKQTSAEEKAFAEGDLGRVQGLLFGDQFDAINGRIDSLEAILLDSIGAIRTEMRKEISSTQKKIERTKNQIDKRIVAKVEKEAAARKSAVDSITEDATAESAQLKSELAAKAAAFEKSLDSLKSATDKAVAANRSLLEEKIRVTEEKLSTSKVDRMVLADLLSTTADQLATEEKSKKIRSVA